MSDEQVVTMPHPLSAPKKQEERQEAKELSRFSRIPSIASEPDSNEDWVQISELKYFNFDFNLEEGRNIKI